MRKFAFISATLALILNLHPVNANNIGDIRQKFGALEKFKIITPDKWRTSPSAQEMKDLVSPYITYPESLEGKHKVDVRVRHTSKSDYYLVDIVMSGLADDAIEAEQYRLLINQPSDWTVQAIGLRWRCYRGSNVGEWTTELCP